MRAWVLLAGAICCEVCATLSLKAALGSPWWYLVVAVGYPAAFGLLFAVLREGVPLGVAYGIWGAVGVALTAVLGLAFFDEPFNALMGFGVLVIVAGVITVEFGSHRAAHLGEG